MHKTAPLSLALLGALLAGPAAASWNLALDKDCLACHGTPPRGEAPTIERLARHSEGLRGNDEKIREAAQKLRARRDAVAHEQLSQADAERLVRWLADGAK
jgi:cytochrome c551/c552